jgi:ATP-binding cassette subfamily B protein
MLVRLLRLHLRRYVRPLSLVVLFQAVQTIAALYLPRLNADIIDNGVLRGDTGYIWRHGAWMLAVTVVQIAFSVLAIYYGSTVAAGFGRDVRTDLFQRTTSFSAREIADLGAPSLITRVTNDVTQVQTLVQMTCTLLVGAPIMAVGGLVMALQEDVPLTGVLAVAIPVMVIVIGNILVRMVPTFRVMQDRIDDLNRVAREQITGMRVVRAFVREPYETDRFETKSGIITRTAMRGGRLMGLMFPTAMAIVNVSSVAAVWFGADRVNSGDLAMGELVAFLTYLTQILMSVLLATYMAALVPRAAVSSERIMEVLSTETSISAPTSPLPLGPLASVEFDHVGFRYPGAEHAVLSGISVTCAAGETLAVIGSTGSGKTTLVNLAARLLDASEGTVRLNGTDVRDLAPDQLWNAIGIVPQKPYLFSGTVASNLRVGRDDATEAEMWAALEIAQAADFVRAMDGGLDATITQGGTNVSGGQRQRLAIARALIRRPALYLFDDSFSALDMATDARLRAALGPWTTEAAVIVVAQRVSSIREATRILVLEDGETVGLGTHDELLSNCPTYQEIVASQLTVDELAAETSTSATTGEVTS